MSIVLRNAVLMIASAVSLGLGGGSFVKSEMREVPVEQRYARYEAQIEPYLAETTYPEDQTAPMVHVRFDLEGEIVPGDATTEAVEAVADEFIDGDGFIAATDQSPAVS